MNGKKRTAKQKSAIKPAAKVAQQPRRKPRVQAPMDPYLHCIAGPVNMPNTRAGYPDGDGRAAVSLEYRHTYTITPVSGTIQVLVAPNASGGLSVISGYTSSSLVDPLNSTSSGYTNIAAGIPNNYVGMIPENQLSTVTNSLPYPTVVRTSPTFRPVVYAADFVYTGSSMMDNGSVVVTKLTNSEAISGSQLIDASADFNADNAVFSPISSALLPSSVITAARNSFNVRSVPVRPLFETTEASVVDNASIVFRPFRTRTSYTTGLGVVPSYHSQCPWYLVTYSGLDSTASITVSIRYCVQYSVTAGSSSAPYAAPSPVAHPSVLERAARFVSSLPVMTPIANSLMTAGYNMVAAYASRRIPALMNH